MHATALSCERPPLAWHPADRAVADARVTALGRMLREPGLLAELAMLEVRGTGRGRARDRVSRLTCVIEAACTRLDTTLALGELDAARSDESQFARPNGRIELQVGAGDGVAFALAALLVAAKTGNAIRLIPDPTLLPALERLALMVHRGLCADWLTLAPPLPCISEAHGHVVLVDETADIAATASRLAALKGCDNGTAPGAATAVLAIGDRGPALLEALAATGAWLLGPEASARAAATLCRAGVPNRTLVGREARVLAIGLGLPPAAASARLFVAEPEGEPLDGPLMRLPGSLVLAFWSLADWPSAVAALCRCADRAGGIRSLTLESGDPRRARDLAVALDIDRIGCGEAEDPVLAELAAGGRLDWRRFVHVTRVSLAPAG